MNKMQWLLEFQMSVGVSGGRVNGSDVVPVILHFDQGLVDAEGWCFADGVVLQVGHHI